MSRVPVYCPSCHEYWWSLDDGIVGMECGIGPELGVVRLATETEVADYYAEVNRDPAEFGQGRSGLT